MSSDEEPMADQLAECEAIIAETRDSEDPVARRRLIEALAREGSTLSKAGRHRDSLAVWDELWLLGHNGESGGRPELRAGASLSKAWSLMELGEPEAAIELTDQVRSECAALDQSDRVRRLRMRAFKLRLRALRQAHPARSMSVDAEVVDAFADVDDPEFRQLVMFALVRRASVLLREGRIGKALEISRVIVERIPAEPDGSLAPAAGMALDHSLHLTKVGGPDPRSILAFFTFVLANTLQEFLRSLTKVILKSGRPLGSAGGSGPGIWSQGLSRVAVPEGWVMRRRRLHQALGVDRAVIDRASSSADPELETLVAKARILSALAQFSLGHPRAAGRSILAMAETGGSGTIQAFQSLAETNGRDPSLPGRIAEVSLLGMRAQALGEGDKEIEQIAYDDSLEARQHRDDPLLVRWLARILRPRVTDVKPGRPKWPD
jgi:hypothetical protein